MATQGFVQVPPDSTGKKIDTVVTTTAAQHRHVMAIGDGATDAAIAPVDATLGVSVKVTQLAALVAGSAVIGHVVVDTAPTTAVTGTFFQATQPVSLAAAPSTAVTNVGTFAVQVTGQSAPSKFANLGANNTLNVKASAGVLLAAYCHNANAADRYLQFHNTATVPVNTNVPVFTFRVPAGGDVLVGTDFFTDLGVAFATGIAFAFSSTINTLTLGVAGDQTTQVQFI